MRRTMTLVAVLFLAALAESVTAVAPQAIDTRQSSLVTSVDAITIPQMLSYQGKLTDTLGTPVPNGSYPMMFLLHTQPSGGSPFWSEVQSVTTKDGLFSVLLGSTNPIGSLPDAGTVYLAMTVSGGPELTPRIRIASAAYSYLAARAADADLLQGRDTTTFSRSTHNHDATYVNEGQADAVTSAMIVNGTIAAADLNQMGASSGQVLKWTGSAWAPRNDSVGSGGGSGTVRKVVQATGVVCSPNPITDSGTVRFDSTWGDARFVNESQTNSVTGAMITDGQVSSADIRDTTVNAADLKDGSVTSPKIALPYSGSAAPDAPVFSVRNALTSNDQPAVYGWHDTTDYFGIGVTGVGGWMGVRGEVTATGSSIYTGVQGEVSGGSGTNQGLSGVATGSGDNYGVQGSATGTGNNYGVRGYASEGSTNYAGYFLGDVLVTGTLSKGGGSFQIDHPLDPLNKYLYHSFVESPDMMNIYNGNIKTDASGHATVILPNWFETLNRDFRYQLTVINEDGGNGFAQAEVARGVKDNSFVVRTSEPLTTVSWQVTGIRQDRFANANRIQVEVDKPAAERGKYLHPELYGQPREAGIGVLPEDPKAKSAPRGR
ncbi:hypothetical protein FJY68_08460 [candidate division WOR-3 bacterium]|uniref:Uncharacterized protein n=1 Tax=candidate division WOR-3 bacterium TaxID=2052148 RepID=A0A937XHR9_UNCW3|nr:hypothetical protein [candidate division WOR-3 bacterium]